MLIATSDAYAQWIGEHQDELRARFHFHTVAASLLTRMNSKDGLIGLLSGLGVYFPATIHVRTLQQFERAAPGLRFPLLVKPADTFRRPLPGGAKNRVFQNLASLATQLYVDCGCDLPLAEYRLLSGGPPPPVGPQREGRQWINLACDLGSWYRRRHALSLRAWLRSALSARSFAALSLDDPLPWVTATADMVAAAPRLAWRSLLRALFRQGAPLSASAGEEPLVEQAMAIDHGLPREGPGPRAGER